MERKNGGTMGLLAQQLEKVYGIGEEYYRGEVKRGLRNSDGTGVLIGVTKVGSVQGYLMQDGQRIPTPGHLYYRGIDLNDIVEAHRASGTFGYEEVAYLLLMGSLPARGELARFKELMNRARKLPDGFTESMILRRPSQNIMNELARSVLALYSYDDDPDDTGTENLLAQSIRLTGSFPAIVANAYAIKRHYFEGESLHIHYPEDKLSTAENFLRMIRPDKQFTEDEAHLLDMMLMLHAEHGGGNNSTFATRVLTSSGTDTYSAISAGIGSLKGPKHGGANIKVAEMVEYIKQGVEDITDADQVADFLKKILRKEAGDGSGLIYGMGHAVYTLSDPRAVILKEHARKFAENTELEDEFKLLELIETLTPNILEELRGDKKVMCANVDLYSGLVYKLLGIPEDLFTPLFTVARVAGWSAHRMEELMTGGKIIRPAYKSVCAQRKYVRLDERLDSYPGELKYIPSDERA